jgi:ABC-type transport system involved in multi-copper enzyme maturation permease subunit
MTWTLAGVTLKRLTRGKALWIGAVFAGLPLIYALLAHSGRLRFEMSTQFEISALLLAVLPAMFVGASVGEEIEDKTSTYLWSRPIERWAVLAGKFVALAPIVVALLVVGWVAEVVLATGASPPPSSIVALAAGAAACSLTVAGIAVVVPKHGTALTIAYMLVDLFIGAMPFSLQQLSITHHVRTIAGVSGEPQAYITPLIAMAAIAGVWAAIGLWRIRRLEV